jgi:alginate O-acetyltransferase complex protein AlgI
VLLTEPTFVLLFLPVFIVLHVIITGATTADWMRGHVPLRALNVFLLIGSIAFFALLELRLAGILLVAAAFTWIVGLFTAGSPRGRSWLAVGLAGLVGLLVTARWLNAGELNVGVLTLPLHGRPAVPSALIAIVLSFFTLSAVAHLVDAWRTRKAESDPVRAMLSLLLFPFLLAGPIVRRAEMHDQIAKRIVSVANFAYGMRRFSIGWFKKVLVADILGAIADTIFALPANQVAAARAWLGVICFGLQIYFAVSAYSDMALGLGRMFGFRLSENFKWPYVSRSLHDFWESWFSTLGQWMRDYLRLPLGGGPLGPMLVALLVAGAWYGTKWTFLVWALYHAGFIVLERLGLGRLLARLPDPVRYAYVTLVVLVGWVFFRADTVPAALVYLRALAGQNVAVSSAYYLNRFLTPEVWVALICGVVGAAPLVRAIGRWRVAIDGATTAIAVMIFALLVYIWRMGVRLVTSPMHHTGSAAKPS